MIEIVTSDVGLPRPEEAPTGETGVLTGRIMPRESSPEDRIGIAQGKFDVPDDIDALNPEVGRLFLGEDQALMVAQQSATGDWDNEDDDI